MVARPLQYIDQEKQQPDARGARTTTITYAPGAQPDIGNNKHNNVELEHRKRIANNNKRDAMRVDRQQQQDGRDPEPNQDATLHARPNKNNALARSIPTTTTKRREKQCRRGWIIVLNTRWSPRGKSHNNKNTACPPNLIGDCGAYSRRCAITKKKQQQGRCTAYLGEAHRVSPF